MDDPRYDSDYDYDEYDEYEYREPGLTNVGLPPGQLALIIGVNAVIALVISIAVVLIANRQVLPGEIATPVTEANEPTAENVQPEGAAVESAEESETEIEPASTPVQSVNYVVEAGDTLSLIAEKFSVPLSDLMIANGLTNRDFIQVGQELVIPIGGLPTPTPTFTLVPLPTDTPLPFDPPTPLPTDAQIPQEPAATVGPSPTPTPTPLPTATPILIPTSTQPPFDEINVVISEVIAPGDLLRETLVILNEGATTSLRDWQLEGSPIAVFTFPDILLFTGSSIRIHTSAGDNTPSDLYLGQGEPIWEPGTTIILSDANSTEISRYVVPTPTPVP